MKFPGKKRQNFPLGHKSPLGTDADDAAAADDDDDEDEDENMDR